MTDRTKAELLQENADLKARLDLAAKAPTIAPEAIALSKCIHACDAIERDRGTYGTYSLTNKEVGAIGRILRSLADRYQVPLIETRYEPCIHDLPTQERFEGFGK